ncbi:hypothetical protein MA03_03145 [Infirmifilum uzonense]|uniref:Uncharacterized protein n=1 Tax=Infirmifilum uzonense TaxID=1550241 RepID=A0A0F7FGV6_9CREN|nr:hypothetical protein MA03_03145 [Infirmifilum uzonense]
MKNSISSSAFLRHIILLVFILVLPGALFSSVVKAYIFPVSSKASVIIAPGGYCAVERQLLGG